MENNDKTVQEEAVESPVQAGTVKLKPKPLTDDFYWFAVAKEMVDKGPEKISESAGHFEKLILWLWGIYTSLVGLGGSVLSLSLGVQFHPPAVALLVSPSFVLFLAYWAATMAESSVVTEFAQNEIADIRRAYNDTVKKRARYYHLSQILTGIACVLIPSAILVSQFDRRKTISVHAEFSKDKKKILVSGDVPDRRKVSLGMDELPMEEIPLHGTSFYREYETRQQKEKTEVYLDYEEDGQHHRLVRTLRL